MSRLPRGHQGTSNWGLQSVADLRGEKFDVPSGCSLFFPDSPLLRVYQLCLLCSLDAPSIPLFIYFNEKALLSNTITVVQCWNLRNWAGRERSRQDKKNDSYHVLRAHHVPGTLVHISEHYPIDPHPTPRSRTGGGPAVRGPLCALPPQPLRPTSLSTLMSYSQSHLLTHLSLLRTVHSFLHP